MDIEERVREVSIWRSVVYQALLDLEKNRANAYDWFFKDNNDFNFVCNCAHIHRDWARKEAQKRLNKKYQFLK